MPQLSKMPVYRVGFDILFLRWKMGAYDKGSISPSGYLRHDGTAIRYIIENPLYSSDMVWNRRTDARFHKISNGMAIDRKDLHGHRLVPNDINDWIVIRDTHKGLISRRQFERAKNKRLNI